MALPIAVPYCIWNASIALTSEARSSVAAWATCALPANVTSPTSMFLGRSRRNSFAASCAAARRVGLTSLTRMLSDTSMASMIDDLAQGSVSVARGRAAANSSSEHATRSNAGGTWRRQGRLAAWRSTSMLL